MVLFIESIWRSKFMYLKLYSSKSVHIIEVQDRNRQIKIDICVDLFFLLVPPCILWFVYGMPRSVQEMIGITINGNNVNIGKDKNNDTYYTGTEITFLPCQSTFFVSMLFN